MLRRDVLRSMPFLQSGTALGGIIASCEPSRKGYLICNGRWLASFCSQALGPFPAVLYLLDLDAERFDLLISSAAFLMVTTKGYIGILECQAATYANRESCRI